MERSATTSNRFLIWAGAGLAALVVVGAVLTLSRSPATFEAGSPEAVVQAYVDAVFNDDAAAARAQFSPELADRCSSEDIRRAWAPDSARVVLVDTRISGDEALVEIAVTETPTDLGLLREEYTYEETLVLHRTAAGWRIAETPWPVYGCSEGMAP